MINLIYSVLPIITMIIGFYFGFHLKDKDELPKIKTPKEIVQEKKKQVEVKEQESELKQYLENLENYPNFQKDFKKG